ncbi:MAG: hypothetical protein JXB30_13520 [Anaerolineae bacterium]|nr:hypothetical protein [Anaerolineae bacterium]
MARYHCTHTPCWAQSFTSSCQHHHRHIIANAIAHRYPAGYGWLRSPAPQREEKSAHDPHSITASIPAQPPPYP